MNSSYRMVKDCKIEVKVEFGDNLPNFELKPFLTYVLPSFACDTSNSSCLERIIINTVKPVLSGHSKRTPKLVFKTNYCLIQVKSIAECSKGSILQYFRPSLSYHLSL